jgi:hypothetical protein
MNGGYNKICVLIPILNEKFNGSFCVEAFHWRQPEQRGTWCIKETKIEAMNRFTEMTQTEYQGYLEEDKL